MIQIEQKQNFNATSLSGKSVAIFLDENIVNSEELSNIRGSFDELHTFENKSDFKEFLKKYIWNNVSTIHTDSYKLFKKINNKNTFFYSHKKNKNDVLVISSEEIRKNINECHANWKDIDETSISREIKKNGKNLNKIIEINNDNELKVSFKIGGLWKVFEDQEINIFFLRKNKLSPFHTNRKMLPEILSPFHENVTETYKIADFNILNNLYDQNFFYEKVNWLISIDSYSEISNFKNKEGYFVYETKVISINSDTKENFTSLIRKLKKGDEVKGLSYKSFDEIDGIYYLRTKYGRFSIYLNEEQIIINSNHLSKDAEFDIEKFCKMMMSNLLNNIVGNTKNNKLKIGELVKGLLGFFVLIILFSITFIFIFSGENILFVFENLFSQDTLRDPWIYLILLCFFFTFLQPLLIAIFMQKVILKKKLDKKGVFTYYVSSMLRHVTLFFTGNYFLSVFVWGWFINKKLEIRTASLVGVIGVSSIIRAIVYSVIGSIFMLLGTTSYFIKYFIPGENNIILIFAISWIGFTWEIFHNLWIFILILLPAFQVIVTNLILKTKSFNRELRISEINNAYQNVLLLRKSSIKLNIKKEKNRLIRMVLLVSLPIIVESLETVLYFDLVDSFALRSSGNYEYFKPYYNFLDTSGLRLVASNIHNFPLINILPGKGIFFSEFGLKNLYENVYINKHNGLELWGSYDSTDLAEMTSFITRFFNVYLMMSVRLMFVLVIMSREFVIRRRTC